MTNPPIYTAKNGQELHLSDLSDTSSEASEHTANIAEEAVLAFNDGVDLGRENDLAGALEKFSEAAKLAPEWPYPLYQAAFTHLLQGGTATALSLYRQVDALEPRGFLTTKTAINALEKERSGVYPEGFYVYFVSHEWEENDDDKRALLKEIIELAPDFAAAYQKLSNLTADHQQRLALIESGLAADPDLDTDGMLKLNQAAIFNLKGKRDQAVSILGELIVDENTTASVCAIAKGIMFDLHQDQSR